MEIFDLRIEQKTVTPLSFLRRFSQEERTAIRTSGDPIIEDFLYLIERVSRKVDLNDPDLSRGLDYLISKEFLQPHRKSEILK